MTRPRDDLLALDGISRKFGPTVALDDVSFALRAGTVHALLGENGAGKTTLMRVAFGMLRADSGRIRIDGQGVDLTSPSDALARGIGMVHQHFTLVPTMTVAENVALGGHGRFDPVQAATRVREIAERTGLPIDPNAIVGTLSVSAQQRCEILKALSRDVRVLILDEPTALLAPAEAADLLRWTRGFASEDRAVVLITHKLRDALSVSDEITVLRRGRVVLSAGRNSLDESTISSAMIGTSAVDRGARAADEAPDALHGLQDRTASVGRPSDVVASLELVSLRDRHGVEVLREVSLKLRPGEIVGIAAIEGAGQQALLRVLAGRLAPPQGLAQLPSRIGFIPEDRHRDALMLDESLTANIALNDAGARQGRMSWRAVRKSAEQTIGHFDVRAPGIDSAARVLSGGNQQKLVVGRELMDRPPLVVAENPTRGLDFTASASVHAALRDAAGLGTAVVFYSSDLDEVLALADRIYVMRGGRLFETAGDRETVGRAMLDS